MARLTSRDLIAIGLIAGGMIAVVTLALLDLSAWALAALAALVAFVGLISRLEFATRRSDFRSNRKDLRAARREARDTRRVVVDQQAAAEARSAVQIEEIRADLIALRAEMRGVRVSQQLLSQTALKAREDLLESSKSIEELHSGVKRIDGKFRYFETDLVNDAQAIGQLLSRYQPTTPLPALSGWAIGPAGLVYLLHAIDERDAQAVVECGSGTSTFWMALAMKQKGSGKAFALEHNPEYAAKTQALLSAHGLEDWAEVCICPLTSVTTPRGEMQWYDLSAAQALPKRIDILLVDGPPGTVGRDARYPAGPLLGPRIARGGLLVLDDADRPDERETIGLWLDEGIVAQVVAKPERGVEVLEVRG